MSDFEVQRSSKANWFACIDFTVLDDERLSPIEKVVFCLLCRFTNWQNRECYPSIKIIAKKANCSERSVVNALKKLIELGLIERRERFNNGRQTTSLYKIIGFEAPCYEVQNAQESEGGCSTFTPPCSSCTHEGESPAPRINDIHNNYNYSNEGSKSPEPKAENPESNQPDTVKAEKPEQSQSYSPDSREIPEAMRATARYLLMRAGRQYLSANEVQNLRYLALLHTPARVQKEIDVAVNRFNKHGRNLTCLGFDYIAACLAHQQKTLKPKGQSKAELKKIQEETQEFASMEVDSSSISNEDFDAVMAEIHGGKVS